MENYVKIFNELKNESGRLKKEALLKSYEDVEGFKDILRFAFDNMIVTGLAKKKIEKNLSSSVQPRKEINTIFEAIDYVKEHNTGNDQDIATIQSFLNKLNEDERELAISILTKDMPFGFSMNTLNKVYDKNFIPKYSVMLAAKYEPGKFDLSKGFSLSLKLDGNRVTIFNYEDGIRAYTRSGKEVEGLVELIEDFKHFPKNFAYDGELIAENPDNLLSKDLFNVTQTIVRRKGEKRGLNFVMFDGLSIGEFNAGKSQLNYKERMEVLDEIFSLHINEGMKIKMVEKYYIGTDESVIPSILADVEKAGYEGLMLNLLDAKYETKRSKGILKIKSFHTVDILCTGIKEDSRQGGKCGSIEVEYKGEKVYAAGLKEQEKILFWEKPETVVGKIVEIKYFEESKNSDGKISLRFPNFIRIREDKSIEDISYN